MEEKHKYIRGGELLIASGPAANHYIDSYGRMWTHDIEYCPGCHSHVERSMEWWRYYD